VQLSDCNSDDHNASGKRNILWYQCLFSAPFKFTNLNPARERRKKKKREKRLMVSNKQQTKTIAGL